MISVAMATYNGEKYLSEQIESILQQTYSDFELIICDDCSTDGTKRILFDYQNKDPRIKVFFNEQNFGFKKNFERALLNTKGEYVAFSDQDDVWSKNHLEVLMKNIDDCDVSCADSLYVDENNISLEKKFSKVVNLQVSKIEKNCFLRLFFMIVLYKVHRC